jgi:ribosomal protein S18 acetylase RimI-like enzyme
MPTIESTKALFKTNSWNFGALYNQKLVAVCATSKKSNRTEIEFGSVHPDYKGKGIGIGLAAYALLTLIKMGERSFATGGAEVNSASKATVEKLGFQIDEIWHSYSKLE